MNNNLKEKINYKEYPKGIILFHKNPMIIKKGYSKQEREFLFTYKDIKRNFKKIIHKWYTDKSLLNLPVSLLIDNFYNIREFNENNFLNIIQAIEAFHRRFRSNEVLTRERYKKKKEEILNTVDKKHRDWLKDRLNFGNEPDLHKRLEDMIKEFSNKTVKRIINDIDTFIKEAKRSRNYYIHYDKEMEKKALKGRKLFYLTEKLKVILICAILYEIGFTKNQIEKLLERNTYYFFMNLLIDENG